MNDDFRLRLTPYSLNTIAKQAHATAVAKGFYPQYHSCHHPEPHDCGQGVCASPGRNLYELLALIHSEVSEALECVRKGMLTAEVHAKGAAVPIRTGRSGRLEVELERMFQSPEGQAYEWVELNPTVAEKLGIELKPVGLPSELADILIRTLDLAAFLGIDIDKALVEKLTYNATRAHRHGGKAA